MNGRRILVTGGAGFIGSNLANALAGANDVIALDDTSLGNPAHLDRDVTFLEADVRDAELPTDVDHVFHLAALSSYGMHEESPDKGANVNVTGFVNVVEQARRSGCDSIVYASTSSIYPSGPEANAEDDPVAANTAYEASKLARERYAEYFGTHYDMSLAGMRFFSVYQGYGGHESHKKQYANVIAQFADDIAHGRRPELYGDGTQTRDFTHVDDVVSALETAADADLHGTFNVGTGTATSFNALVGRLAKRLGRDLQPRYVQNPIPEHVYVSHTCADTEKLRTLTGWQPQIELDEGMRRVCAQYAEA